jgi:hypothetical protein
MKIIPSPGHSGKVNFRGLLDDFLNTVNGSQNGMSQDAHARILNRCLWLNSSALAFSLLRVMIDFSLIIILFSELLWIQGILLGGLGFAYGWWGWSLARAGRDGKSGMVSLLLLSFLWAGGNGASSLLTCPPPCGGLNPYNPIADISHLGSLVFGATAAYSTVRIIILNRKQNKR